MRNSPFAALAAHQRAPWSRRTVLAAFIRGLPAALAVGGGNWITSGDAQAKSCSQQCKKKNTARQRRKCRKKCDRPKPPNCDVCRSGCAFTSVQAAIDAATPGSTIRLCAGVFAEQLDISKDITLIGAGDGEGGTTLDGGDVITGLVHIQDANVTLERLRITGAAGSFGGGISSLGSTLTLTACTVSGNTAAVGGGIFKQNGNLTLRDSVVTDNAVGLNGGGIYSEGGDLILVDSRVEGNRADDGGGGIFHTGVGTVALVESVVTGNTPDNCVGVSGCG